MPNITPFLWFDNQAEEAAKFYVSVFKNSKITGTTRYGEAPMPDRKGTVMTVAFRLDGNEFTALNGGPQFKFSQATSFVVHCKTQKQIDRYWDKLSKGGSIEQCGWLKDKYGVSWQITPTVLIELLQKKSAKKVAALTAAMLEMTKLDIKKLQDAYKNG